MALARNLADLPAAAKTSEDGRPPDAEPTFLRPYFDHLVEQHEAEGERPHSVAGTRFRHSMAGACSRQIAYHALGVEASNPMDLAGIVVTGNGTSKHDEIQAVLMERYAGLEVEVACKVDALDGSGSADGVLITTDPQAIGPDDDAAGTDVLRICWEHKNVGGFAFKMAIGERGVAQGPKHEHIVQAALNAKAQDADLVVITYLTWEAVSVNIAKRKKLSETGRVAAQWTFTRDEWEPLADFEIGRVNSILALLDEGMLPARKIPSKELPAGHVISHPPTGGWEHKSAEGMILDAGTFWACGYCRWQDVCAGTSAQRQPIAEVAVHLGLSKDAA